MGKAHKYCVNLFKNKKGEIIILPARCHLKIVYEKSTALMNKILLQKREFCSIVNSVKILHCVKMERRRGKSMSEKTVVVSNAAKARNNPVAELVQVACQFDSNIILESENKKINAKSIMGIMAFNPVKGMSIHIIANGKDEDEAVLAMERFLVCD
jgi:phosphocarrier protein